VVCAAATAGMARDAIRGSTDKRKRMSILLRSGTVKSI
jgi:hypothetical protein